jgi:hypothetical protein
MGFGLARLKNRIICFFLLASLFCPAIAYSVPADVTDISDSKYFDPVHNSLVNAKKSIYVSLYRLMMQNLTEKMARIYTSYSDIKYALT